MAFPTPPSRSYSYTGFSSGQGDNSFPGPQVDADLDSTNTAVGALTTFLQTALADDGSIKTGSITSDMLASSLTLGLQEPTVWTTATVYAADNTVFENNSLYRCATAHTAGVFATDLAAGKWVGPLATIAPLTSVSDGAITTAKLADDAVTAPKIADGAVGAPQIASGAITPVKAAVSFGHIPVGGEMAWPGVNAPAGWLLEYGQPINRTTYASLLAAITVTFNATRTLGSAVLTAVSVDLTTAGLVGAAIEGAGIPNGATISAVTATTISLSTPATSSGSIVSTTVFPHGNGDGSTTFNVPDARGRVIAGRDDMGGSAASRLSSGLNGDRLGAAGGAQTHTLTTGEMPVHSHTVADPGHSHTVVDPGHAHTVQTSDGTYSAGDISVPPGATVVDSSTTANFTGVTVAAALTGVTVANAGSGGAHANIQPTRISNMIIFAGV